MNSLTLNKPWSRTSAWARALSLVALAAGAWALSSTQAHASDVHFSVGVHAPGVSLGVSNGYGYHRPPVYYAPPPVYYSPPPVYYSPPPVYYSPPPVYHRGVRPVAVVPPPIYYEKPRHRRDWDRRDRHDRHDRDDRRRHRHGHGHGY